MRTFKQHLSESDTADIQNIRDLRRVVPFVRRSDNYSGTFHLNKYITELIELLENEGYKYEFNRDGKLFEKKGLPVLSVVTDEAQTIGTIYIERHNISE